VSENTAKRVRSVKISGEVSGLTEGSAFALAISEAPLTYIKAKTTDGPQSITCVDQVQLEFPDQKFSFRTSQQMTSIDHIEERYYYIRSLSVKWKVAANPKWMPGRFRLNLDEHSDAMDGDTGDFEVKGIVIEVIPACSTTSEDLKTVAFKTIETALQKSMTKRARTMIRNLVHVDEDLNGIVQRLRIFLEVPGFRDRLNHCDRCGVKLMEIILGTREL